MAQPEPATTAGPPPDALCRALATDVLSCTGDRQERLRRHLSALARRQDLSGQAALFEEVVTRMAVDAFWVLYAMSEVYADLGRADLAFYLAARAVQAAPPELTDLFAPIRRMFVHHRAAGHARVAVEVFLRQARRRPDRTVAERWEIDPLLAGTGLSLDSSRATPSREARLNHAVFPVQRWTPKAARHAGGPMPAEIARLGTELRRPAVTVAELRGATLFVCRDKTAVVDRDGNEHVDLSLSPYPRLVREGVEADAAAETIELDEAVVVLDGHPSPNLGHFLFDQMSRLVPYRRAGARLDRCTVIGAGLATTYQQELAARAGIAPWLSTDRVAVVRVGRLFVANTCRENHHPGHQAAPWAMQQARTLLDAATTPGSRRIHVSRADGASRRVRNEAELVRALAGAGFETIVPGAMAYADQVEAFRSASHVVGTHGAALAHLAACAPGTHLLEMFHPLYATWSYALPARACGLDYAVLAGRDGVSDAPEFNDPNATPNADRRHGHRDIRVDPQAVLAWLRTCG